MNGNWIFLKFMTKCQKVAEMLEDAGFIVVGHFRIIKGPKVKSDVLECWNVDALHNGIRVEINSGQTMTELCKRGLKVVPNRESTCLYGDYIAETK